MSNIPPEYEQTHKELDDAIKNPPKLSEDQLKDSLKTLDSTVNSPESNAALIDEINKLSAYALSIDDSFHKVEVTFNNVNSSGISPGLKQDISTLTTTWKQHRATYINLLWESRKVAGTAQAAADDFAVDFTTFLADDDVTLEEKKTEIRNYIEKLTRDEQASQTMSQGFTQLQKDIVTFQEDWQKVVEKHDMEKLRTDIKDLDDAIAGLDVVLADLQAKIKKLAIAVGVLSASAGITGALGFICPLFWIGTLLSVIGVGVSAALLQKAVSERDNVLDQIKTKTAERAEKAADLRAVQELQAGLASSESDFQNICEKLAAFATVWAIIRADIQAIEEKLDYAHGTGSAALFKTRLKTAATLYATLGKALRQYQIAVNPEHKVFKKRK